jgi:hypothetical protein
MYAERNNIHCRLVDKGHLDSHDMLDQSIMQFYSERTELM